MTKAFFLDIDGTILEENRKEIREDIIRGINELKDLGHKVYICTGRSYDGAMEVVKPLNVDGYVLSNGQEVILDGEIVHQEFFEQNKAISLIESIKEHTPHWACETRDGIHVLKGDRTSELVDTLHGYGLLQTKEVAQLELENTYQFWAFGEKDEVTNLEANIEKDFSCYKWEGTALEIAPKETGKGKGVLKVIEHLKNSGHEEVLSHGFGDGVNDFTMMKEVDISVAMGNAKKELKEVCKIVTDNIENNGLLKAFNQLK